MNKKLAKFAAVVTLVGIATSPLTGCTSSGENSDNVVVGVPIVYTKRHVDAMGDPLDTVTFAPGGNLMFRDLSSPSAEEINITGSVTKGTGGVPDGDVADPEVSDDAKKVIFSMREPGQGQTFNVWIWYRDADQVPEWAKKKVSIGELGVLVRVINDDAVANDGDDIDPNFLPGGKIVFASTRQKISSQQKVTGEPTEPTGVPHRDEYERRAASLLHVMNPADPDNAVGSGDGFIDQISFNQSHDRDPQPTPEGEILFSRWDHLGPKNHFPLFTTRDNGVGLFVRYGAFSGVTSFIHPRLVTGGRHVGKVVAAGMPLQGTQEGGALYLIDINNFTDNGEPVAGASGAGQVKPQPFGDVNVGRRDTTDIRRIATPFPMRDGSNRILVAFSRNDVNLLPDADGDGQMERRQTPRYGIFVVDLDQGTNRTVVPWKPEEPEFVYTDPVSLEVHPDLGNTVVRNPPVDNDPRGGDLTASGLVTVQSVFDNDDRFKMMGSNRYTEAELAALAAAEKPNQPIFTDGKVNIEAMVAATADNPDIRPFRYFRVTQAVPNRGGSINNMGIGGFEMHKIVGYGMVDPDGSLSFKMPADTPFTISILDKEGRSLNTHLNWIQVRAGEKRTCKGCHSPRSGDPKVNPGIVQVLQANNANAVTVNADFEDDNSLVLIRTTDTTATGLSGSTHYGTSGLDLSKDPEFEDVWLDDTKGTRVTDIISYTDTSTANPAITGSNYIVDILGGDATPEAKLLLENGIINYTQHIQPIWEKHGCAAAGCHAKPANVGDAVPGNLVLTADIDAAAGRLMSYEQLTGDRIVFDANGSPVLVTDPETNELVPDTYPNLVVFTGNRGISRGSRLTEVLFGEKLNIQSPGFYTQTEARVEAKYRADNGLEPTQVLSATQDAELKALIAAKTDPKLPNSGINHWEILSRGEKRVITEWMDLGAQYFNLPSLGKTLMGSVDGLDQRTFENSINAILVTDCIQCHAAGNGQAHSFVLTETGVEGNFAITSNFVNGNNPFQSPLLTMPTQGDIGVANPVFVNHPAKQWDPNNTNFQAVRNWICDSLGIARQDCVPPQQP